MLIGYTDRVSCRFGFPHVPIVLSDNMDTKSRREDGTYFVLNRTAFTCSFVCVNTFSNWNAALNWDCSFRYSLFSQVCFPEITHY